MADHSEGSAISAQNANDPVRKKSTSASSASQAASFLSSTENLTKDV
jgi:hypothetical protein